MGDARFWSKVNKTEGCWEWTALKDRDGYGVFTVIVNGVRKYRKAHRVAYEMEYGSSPAYDGNLQLRHYPCGNPSCVRPDHLIPGTALENAHDAFEHGTRGKLSDGDVADILAEMQRDELNQRQIAAKFGVSHSTVTMIRQGKIHKNITDRFELPTTKGIVAKLSEEDVTKILVELNSGNKVQQKEIARKFGVTPDTISLINRGKIHKEVFRKFHSGYQDFTYHYEHRKDE